MRSYGAFIGVAVSSMALASPAWAAFQDNLESSTPGSPPATATTATQSAQPGDWYIYGGTSPDNTEVTDAASPGAGEGSNYLHVNRPVGGTATIAAAFESWEAPQSGGIVTAQWQMYLPSTDNSAIAGIWLTSSLNNDNNQGLGTASPVLFVFNNGTVRYSINGFSTNEFLAAPVAQLDTWQDWTLTTDLTTQQATLTIDGVTSDPFGFNNDVNAANALVFFGPSEGSGFFVDNLQINVPEPVSLALATLGASVLLVRRQQR